MNAKVQEKDDSGMTARIAVPRRADAERAAAALADAGVSRVVLFGSVARGDATERSDIDLAAIYDDLDYGTRSEQVKELSSLASAAAGYPVEVFVTDRPEWKVGTEQVRTSFEARAAREGVVLVDRGAGEVNWDKEMVRPSSDYEAALTRLRATLRGLIALQGRLSPGRVEQLEQMKGGEARVSLFSDVRLGWACAHVQHTVEAALKALIHLSVDRESLAWGHDINQLCSELSEPHRRAVRSRLSEAAADEITLWHTGTRRRDDGRADDPAAPEMVAELTKVGCAVAAYTARQFGDEAPDAHGILDLVKTLENRAAGCDLLTGRPLAGWTDRDVSTRPRRGGLG